MNGKISSVLVALTAAFVLVIADDFTTVTDSNWVFDVSDFEVPWATAVETCQARNQRLLTIGDAEKDRTVVDLFVNGKSNVTLPGNNIWTSAYEFREGAWMWQPDQQPLIHHRWMIGQPDDLENINCAYAASTALFYWRDANCSAPMFFICEAALS